MKTLHAHLRLSPNLTSNTRERCPDVVFRHHEVEVSAIRTDSVHPELPFENGEIDRLIVHDDAMSRTIDEEAWLQEFQRVLAAGGELRFTLPATGSLGWLDAMNIFRYVSDITKRGPAPSSTLPTGWNRHYSRDQIAKLLEASGFSAPELRWQNNVLSELGMLTGLIQNNLRKQDRNAERELFSRFGQRHPDDVSRILRTTWSVRTISLADGDEVRS